ncbi:DUF6153 family protein [Streptomyces sp. NPDC050448]|uniref:DUF6153 family protein n=1 Tax=Streptomyces sp. NPDC050448 TaxID=3155404 RepID=UPI0034293784
MLLVIAVLTGLVAMHGLGSAGPLPAGAASPHSAHQTVTAAATQPCACHDDDGSTDRHAGHADQMCASGAVAGAVFVPTLTTCAPGGIDTTASTPLSVSYEPSGGRAPPTPAQLQLLRI